jgi:peptidoglycan/xylan/chitin deacetylase (PgdA/CDA1 family)
VDLYDLSLAITGKRDLPEKPVIITMDDGYRDNFENAFPILQEFGLSATFFIVTQPIDDGNEIYMTWEMVEEMANAGMRIEPHSKTHADLSSREKEYIIYEILGSQESIAAHTGQTPRFFCYPGGRYDETTIEVVSDLDFWGAVTTEGGEWHGYDDRYEWSRIRMRNTTTLAEFTNLVDPGETVSGKTVES